MATLAVISALLAVSYAIPTSSGMDMPNSVATANSDSLSLRRAVRSASECTKSANYTVPKGTEDGDGGDEDCEDDCDCNGLRICSASDGVCVGNTTLSCTDPKYNYTEKMRTKDNKGKKLVTGPVECLSACDCNGTRECSVFGTCYTPPTNDEYNKLIDAVLAGEEVCLPPQFEGSPKGSNETFFSIMPGTSLHVNSGESLNDVMKGWRRCNTEVKCKKYQNYFRGGVQLCELGASSDDGYQCTKKTCCKRN